MASDQTEKPTAKRLRDARKKGQIPRSRDLAMAVASVAATFAVARLGGRLITGWVRGTGRESVAHNAQPPFNWERFQEAHDFVVKTWTTDGPFRWEGEHYHYRYVSIWPRPIQQPLPPIFISGSSKESAEFAARRRIGLGLAFTYLEAATPAAQLVPAGADTKAAPPELPQSPKLPLADAARQSSAFAAEKEAAPSASRPPRNSARRRKRSSSPWKWTPRATWTRWTSWWSCWSPRRTAKAPAIVRPGAPGCERQNILNRSPVPGFLRSTSTRIVRIVGSSL